MNAHDRALELVATRVDFALTASEGELLHRHLDACTQCRGDAEGVARDARRLAARPVHRLAPERAAAMRLSIERPRRGMSPAMVLVAAALLLLAGIATAAVGSEIIRRLEDPHLAVLPVPSNPAVPSSAPSPAASPSPVSAQPGIRWSAVDGPDIQAARGFEHSFLESDRGTMIQVRYQEGKPTTIVALTRDGITWTRDEVASNTIPAGIALDGGADWMQLVDREDGRLVLWSSTDGFAWTQVGVLPKEIGGAWVSAANGSSLLVCGAGTGWRKDLADCAHSADGGRTWTWVKDLGATIDMAGIRGIVPFGTGFLAIVEGQVEGQSIAFTSEDGTTWIRQPEPVPNRAVEVAVLGDTAVAFGAPAAGGETTAVATRDGVAWESVTLPAIEGNVLWPVRTGDVLLAPVMWSPPEGALWASDVLLSSDGRTWVAGGIPAAVAEWQTPTFLPVEGGVIVFSGDQGTMMLGTVTGGPVR